jgi:hypothetical protein
MINLEVYSQTLAQHATIAAPPRLYHYTSPEALIGIVSNKEIWATNTLFLNDSSEAIHAIKLISSVINERIERNAFAPYVRPFMEELSYQIGATASRSYVASFTELQDSLSQWRAYCPASGGYAVGLPSIQIYDMSDSQGFMLVKVIYEHDTQVKIINEVIDAVGSAYERRREKGDTPERFQNFVTASRDYFAQLALMMKHYSFQEEQEWRLMAYNINEIGNSSISFRGSHKGVIPFFKFKLANSRYPNMVERDGVNLVVFCGPAPDRYERQTAVQFLLAHHLGYGAAHGSSDIPYKTW